jgi:hypothetical protein
MKKIQSVKFSGFALLNEPRRRHGQPTVLSVDPMTGARQMRDEIVSFNALPPTVKSIVIEPGQAVLAVCDLQAQFANDECGQILLGHQAGANGLVASTVAIAPGSSFDKDNPLCVCLRNCGSSRLHLGVESTYVQMWTEACVSMGPSKTLSRQRLSELRALVGNMELHLQPNLPIQMTDTDIALNNLELLKSVLADLEDEQ